MALYLRVDTGVLKTVVFCTGAIFAKSFLTVACQGYARVMAGTRPPEDTDSVKQTLGEEVPEQALVLMPHVTEEAALVSERWNRIVLNDLENLPLGLTIMCFTALVTGTPGLHKKACYAFVAARYGHTLMYASGSNAWSLRSACWMVSVGSIAPFIYGAHRGMRRY